MEAWKLGTFPGPRCLAFNRRSYRVHSPILRWTMRAGALISSDRAHNVQRVQARAQPAPNASDEAAPEQRDHSAEDQPMRVPKLHLGSFLLKKKKPFIPLKKDLFFSLKKKRKKCQGFYSHSVHECTVMNYIFTCLKLQVFTCGRRQSFFS